MMVGRRSGLGSVCLLLALTGCAQQPTAAPPAQSLPATPTAVSGAPTPVPSASFSAPVPDSLRFTSTTVDGARFDAATLAGRPAVLWFWAAWCSRCRAAAGNVAEVSRDYSGRVGVVGVAGLSSGQAPMTKFVKDTGISGFSNLADDDGAVWQRFGVVAQEYYVLIDKDGKVVHKGALSESDLRARLDKLVG